MRDFAGLRVHVIGLGSLGTGRAVARVVAARGAQVTVSDRKPAEALIEEIAALEGTGAVVLAGDEAYRGIETADLIVPSPGVPFDLPVLVAARARGVQVVSEIEVAFWLAPCPVLAVTGTKGKTTTTALLGELLRDAGRSVHVGGNIGQPLIELAAAASPTDLLVAEVSSFQLEATEQFRPQVAVMLNLFPDHLDRHGTMETYGEAKARVFANQEASDTAVLNHDETAVWELRTRTRAALLPYRLSADEPTGADLHEGWLRVQGQRICPASAVRLPGRHNLGNALAALAAAHAAGASLDKAEGTLTRFPGVEHRLEVAGSVGGVLFVNDSQATTPAATIAALEAFDRRVVLIAGGRAKVHDFNSLAQQMHARSASLVVIGEAAEEIAAAARKAGVTEIARAASLPEAVAMAYRQARPDGVVLLSPACASFDMFANMAERGRVFKQAMQGLAQEVGLGTSAPVQEKSA
jgi:UDP-N-acetylmuramoylalanine--D-glutamate ligase